jgi:major membrane immunogen (membrane-anchored lipoprotein)
MSPAITIRKVVLFGVALVLLSCGGKSSDDAANAFENGNYKLAIQLYSEALQNDPANTHYKERIALCYMYRGLEYFNTTGNVKSFSGNFEKALEFIPEQTSQEFKQIYSDMLFRLSDAYISAKPQNEIEREDFINKAITDLNEALNQNPGNHAADSLLIKIKMDNFEKMFEKGKKFYTEAEKTGKEELYFSAEYYLKEAAEFDAHNDEVKKLLSKTREKSLPLINVNDDIALAIGDYTYQNNQLIIDLRIQNFLTNPLQVDVDKFELVGADGRIYSPDKETMAGKLKSKSMRNTTLDQKKNYLDGLLVFPVSKNVKLDYLTYRADQTRVTKKYFP